MDFDDFCNRVFGCVIEVHRFNNSRLKNGIKRFVLSFLRALRVLRGGLIVGPLAIGLEIATGSLPSWKAESFTALAERVRLPPSRIVAAT